MRELRGNNCSNILGVRWEVTGSQVEVEELRVDKSVAKSSLITVRRCQRWQMGRCDGGMSGRYFF